MTQRTIGVRQAKARLSQVLRDVQRGAEWIVTERGRPVARILPIDGSTLPLGERIRRLEEDGVMEPARPARPLPPPLPLPEDLARTWLDTDRNR